MRNVTRRWPQSGHNFQKLEYFQFLKKCRGDLATLPPQVIHLDIFDLKLKNSQTTLLDFDWFYDIMDLGLKNTRTTLLNLELKENDSIVTSTIIKKMCHGIEAC